MGVISSPFLLGATILHHLEQVGTPTADKIMKHMYVDNLLTGVNSSKEVRARVLFRIKRSISRIIPESEKMGVELERISEVNSRAG